MELGNDLKKIILLGIGAAAATVEKSQDLIDELVKKGQLTLHQGKVLNEELHRNTEKNKSVSECTPEDEVQKQSENDIDRIKTVFESMNMANKQKIEDLCRRVAALEKHNETKQSR